MLRLVGEQGNVNVLEKFPGENAENAIREFGEVVALAAGVPTPESIGEAEAGGELFGFDEEASAISDPGICIHSADRFCLYFINCPGLSADHDCRIDNFLLRAKPNVRGKLRLVNSVFLVQLRKRATTEFDVNEEVQESSGTWL